jgi:hypothetical protein
VRSGFIASIIARNRRPRVPSNRLAVGLSWSAVDNEIDQSSTATVFARFNFK